MAYVARAHLAASAIVPSSDYNQGMDNEAYLKSEHDLATPAALNAGWRQDGFTWTYVSASIFGISGQSPSLIYQKGTRIRWKDGGAFKYGVSVCSSGSRFAFTGGGDYSASSGAAVTDNHYSYELSPFGYPGWFNYDAVVVGFSSSPADSGRFQVNGREVVFAFDIPATTSNATNFTVSLPVVAGSPGGTVAWRGALGVTYDAGAAAAVGTWAISQNDSAATLYKSALGGWTNSGTKGAQAVTQYEI